MPTTILLVDDHPVFRKGLRFLLEDEKDMSIVGEAGNGRAAIDLVRELSPDMVVMDITMPDLNGIDATRQILSESPDTKVVALSVNSGKRFVKDMLLAGAVGYILKESVPEEMIKGIRTVVSGDVYLSKSIAGVVVSEYRNLASETEGRTGIPSEPILRTKLHRPPIGPDILPRARLRERLDQGRSRLLTLISAAAGYGKSTLASRWLEACDCPCAWISLDENDNDLRVFLSYITSAVGAIFPAGVEKTRVMLKAPNLPPLSVLAPTLVNDLETIDEDFILCLDDYHRIHETTIHDLMAALLQHPPRAMHFVLIARRDPPLPLITLRARRQINEITMEQLRFTREETAAFLEKALELPIDDSTAAVLEEKVEGWVTGLRLAALSVRGGKDLGRLLSGAQKGFHYVTDYLVSEVISRQPPAMARCMIYTAVLDRFCPALCEAIHVSKGEPGEDEISGQAFIEWLEKCHLFVVPLDEQHRWFRYHHLFQQLLQDQLKRQRSPEEIAALHSRASEWFESEGLMIESIKHALVAGDAARAAEIIERYRNNEFTADRWYNVSKWLSMLPEKIKRERPKLLMTEAWIRYLQHLLARIPMLLDRAESLLRSQTAKPVALAEIAFFRGFIAYFEGEAEQSLKYLENAVSTLAGTKAPILGDTELLLGLARCMNGNKDLAVQALESRLGEIDSSEPYLLCRLIASLAYIHMLSGDLYQLQKEGQRLLDVSKKHNMSLAEAWGYYFLAFGYLHAGKLEAALSHFVQVDELRYVMEPRAAIDALAGLALTQQFLQREVEAEKSIQRLQEFARELNERSHFSLAQTCQARLSLLQGDVTTAVEKSRLADESLVPAELFSWFEAPAITQARALIAEGSEESVLKASKLLQSIRDVCETCRFTCQVIEVAVLQSRVLARQGHTEKALAELDEVVALAGPRGWIRPFLEAGKPMADLLKRLHKHNPDLKDIERILDAFENIEKSTVPAEVLSKAPRDHPLNTEHPATWSPRPQPLVEPLTNRELEILELLVKRLQNKEIADQLFISAQTVKTHLANIYGKLAVRNRRQAADKAKALGIV